MSISYDFVQNFILSNLQQVTMKGMNFLARCPLCGDSTKNVRKKRFNLKYDVETGGYYHCFNCGKAGSFTTLYAHIKGISDLQAYKELKKKSFNSIKTAWTKPKKADEEIHQNGYYNDLKKDWIGINNKTSGIVQKEFQKRLIEFLDKRALPKTYPFYIAYSGFYKNRIIVPVIDGKNNIIYFQGRSLEKDPSQKYINPVLSSKKLIIMNEHKFNCEKYIIITEGIFDACLVGDQGTCCFGASIDDIFLSKLKDLTKKSIIIALDNDITGIQSMIKITKDSRYAKNLMYFKMPYKDIKDINELVMKKQVENVYDFVVKNSYNYLEYIVKLKIEKVNL